MCSGCRKGSEEISIRDRGGHSWRMKEGSICELVVTNWKLKVIENSI